ncbi:MAG: hypothetical protein WA728_03380, partial [Xanthobacteraceae bacterium]
MYRLIERSPVAANTIGIEVVAFLTAGKLMSYRPSHLLLVWVSSPPEDLITLAHRPDDGCGQQEK